MSLSDYNGLVQSIENWSKRDDVSNMTDDFILLAENEINKGLQLRTNEKRAISTLNTDDRFLVLPDDFLEMRALRCTDGGQFYDMFYRAPETMNILGTAGRPFFFTINNRIEFDRIPDKAYVMEMTYYVGLTPLSSTNTTNNVLTAYPDLYLYGCLSELHKWSRDEDTAVYYEQLFQERLATANAQEKRGRYGPAPAMRSEGPTP